MINPTCPYFGECGGCSSQNITYPDQLAAKKEQLARAINCDPATIRVFSGYEYGYRNRLDLAFHPTGVGLRKKGTWWQIVDIAQCAISEPLLNRILTEVRDFFTGADAFNVRTHEGTFRYAVIRTTSIGNASVSFILNSESPRITEAETRIIKFANITSASAILLGFVSPHTDLSTSENFRVIKGDDELEEDYLGKRFSFAIQGFFQNNHAMAECLHTYVHDLLKNSQTSNAHLIDLYGGVGTFGILNAHLFKTVTTIEGVAACTVSARKNAERNSIHNITATTCDAKNINTLFPAPATERLFVVTDPPRSGMHPKTIKHLNTLLPETIMYISCNVRQLKQELPIFSEYRIRSAALFDLFPQTPHSEAVIELVHTNP